MSASNSLGGRFLVASPHLSDPNFYRSVVLMIQHDESGAFGLILNRPTDRLVSEVWEYVADEPCGVEHPVSLGGPVDGLLTALHGDRRSSDAEVVPGVFFSSSQEHLDQLLDYEGQDLRIFLGYAGWAGGQLEAEMESGGWLSAAASKELVFGDQERMWKETVERIGLEILEPTIKATHIPTDPGSN